MSAHIIDGKKISLDMRNEMSKEIEGIKKTFKVTPCLAVILVGNDPASQVYVSNKEKAAHQIGMNSIQFKMSGDISGDELINKIKDLNNDDKVHGILVQLPLPDHIDTREVIYAIDPKKDVDGFHILNVGKLAVGDVNGPSAAMVPCTPSGCVHLLKLTRKTLDKTDDLSGLKALVIGTSNIVGRPLTRLLMLEKCTVTIANRATKDLKAECLQSDVIISAAGKVNLVTKDMVKEGTIIIDVGINRTVDEGGKSRLVGDVDFENVKEVAKAITPVPGGVGPMTITYLLKNTITCCLNLLKN